MQRCKWGSKLQEDRRKPFDRIDTLMDATSNNSWGIDQGEP
jgi:hypothetical protein